MHKQHLVVGLLGFTPHVPFVRESLSIYVSAVYWVNIIVLT